MLNSYKEVDGAAGWAAGAEVAFRAAALLSPPPSSLLTSSAATAISAAFSSASWRMKRTIWSIWRST